LKYQWYSGGLSPSQPEKSTTVFAELFRNWATCGVRAASGGKFSPSPRKNLYNSARRHRFGDSHTPSPAACELQQKIPLQRLPQGDLLPALIKHNASIRYF